MVLLNGNVCSVGDHVIVHDCNTPGKTFISIVKEIIRHVASIDSVPASVLVEQVELHSLSPVYDMPLMKASHVCLSVLPKV